MENLVLSLDTTDFVKQAMMKIDRIHFCMNKKGCYTDRPSKLSDGYYDSGQTITAPHMHALAIEYLEPVLKPGNSILDIGSGSGYLCAVFGTAVNVYNKNEKFRGKVIGLETVKPLVEFSKSMIQENYPHLMKYKRNFNIMNKDGKLGYPSNSKEEKYDGIHIGASCEYIPFHLLNQLKKGGIMVIPLKIRDNNLILCIVTKDKIGNIHIKEKMPVRYVPLI
jgi:protein-L-isoaspartate(D-aspartate) O-methyltransferase